MNASVLDGGRRTLTDHLIESGELERAKKGSAFARKPKEAAQSLVARLQAKGEGHARSVLQQMAKMLGTEVVEKEARK